MSFLDLNDSVIADVRRTADIVDIISQVTTLKPAGRRMTGLCPFHREKTPSFSVDRSNGLFYCFGCGKGGDIFKFVMETERLSFPEAVEYVANRVGIELPRKQRKSQPDRDDLLEILEGAAGAFHDALRWTPNASDEYLEKRGIDAVIRTKYGFGHATDSWDYVQTRLGRKFSTEQLEKAGLVLPRKTGSGYYDRFRNRLMIPIHSESGTIVGFGGRTLDGSDPKYLNSPEGAVFNKSRLLYNLHRAKEQMRKLERAILVEGYFDCIALDHAGVPGVVASMGTSLTPGQASLMRRFARQVIIAYDGDEAGRNATFRAAPVLMAAGLTVNVIDVGPGHDPDSYIKEFGPDGFTAVLGSAKNVFDAALERWAANPGAMNGTEKREVLDRLLPMLSSVSDPVERNHATTRIAERLRLEFQTVWSLVKPSGNRTATAAPQQAPISTGEKQLLGAWLSGRLSKELFSGVREEYFEDQVCRNLYLAMKSRLERGLPLDFLTIQSDVKGEAELTRISELALGDEAHDNDITSLEDILRRMERRYIERRSRDLQQAIQEAIRLGDSEMEHQLLTEKTELSKRLHGLK